MHCDESDLAQRAVDRRARRGARARGAALGLALARADGAEVRVDARRCSRRAVRGGRLVGNGRAPSLHAARRGRAGRRGDHVPVFVRRFGELRDLRRRDARVRGHRPAHVQPRPGRGRGGDHRAHEGDRRRGHLRVSRASSTSWPRSASGTVCRSSRTRARRSARATRASPSVRTGIRPSGPSIRTSR